MVDFDIDVDIVACIYCVVVVSCFHLLNNLFFRNLIFSETIIYFLTELQAILMLTGIIGFFSGLIVRQWLVHLITRNKKSVSIFYRWCFFLFSEIQCSLIILQIQIIVTYRIWLATSTSGNSLSNSLSFRTLHLSIRQSRCWLLSLFLGEMILFNGLFVEVCSILRRHL